MHKLVMLWLMGAAVLALSPLDTARAQPADEQTVDAEARVEQLRAVLDKEDEGLLDADERDEPDSQGDVEDDDELGSPGEWGTPT